MIKIQTKEVKCDNCGKLLYRYNENQVILERILIFNKDDKKYIECTCGNRQAIKSSEWPCLGDDISE